MSSTYCGCDPEAGWTCREHQASGCVDFDAHASCREALMKAWEAAANAGQQRIKQVVRRTETGLEVLDVIRVDAFEDGLRILVK